MMKRMLSVVGSGVSSCDVRTLFQCPKDLHTSQYLHLVVLKISSLYMTVRVTNTSVFVLRVSTITGLFASEGLSFALEILLLYHHLRFCSMGHVVPINQLRPWQGLGARTTNNTSFHYLFGACLACAFALPLQRA